MAVVKKKCDVSIEARLLVVLIVLLRTCARIDAASFRAFITTIIQFLKK